MNGSPLLPVDASPEGGFEVRDLLALTGLLILALLLWWLLAYQPFDRLYPIGDAYDYADIGRRLLRGSWLQGVTAGIVPPLALTAANPPVFLSAVRPPLFPLTLALTFSILGASDRVVAATTSAFFFLSIPILYLLGRRVFSPVVSLAATVAYILSTGPLTMSTSGLTEPLFTVLLLACLLLTYNSAQKPGARLAPLLAGILAGLGYLTRYNMIVFVPLAAVYLYLAACPHRWRRVGLFFGGWCLATAIWLFRNLVLFGNPLFSLQQWEMLMFTVTYPRFILYKHVQPPALAASLLRQTGEIAVKIKETLYFFYEQGPDHLWTTSRNPYILVLLLVSLFLPLDRPRAAFGKLVAAMALVQLLALSLLHPIPRLFYPFYPLLLLFGFNALVTLLGRGVPSRVGPELARWLRLAALALTILFLSMPTLEKLPEALSVGFIPRRLPLYNHLRYGDSINYIRTHTRSDDILICSDPKIPGWYGDRVCIWTPAELDMVDDIETMIPIKGIYLTGHLLYWAEERAWHEIYTTRPEQILDGHYYLEAEFDDGSLFYQRRP